ncbi:MAG TPA: YihY/virulence factor BrkB family protein [Edaphocola sp.]|nr:YihY/virulence factor BrkB family protein [Edaphocola sp.]
MGTEEGKGIKKTSIHLKKPEFRGLTLGWILRDIFYNLERYRLFERAAAITFNWILAVPPALIFLVSLVPFFPIDNLESGIINTINTYFPEQHIGGKMTEVVSDFLHTRRKDLLSFSLLVSMIYASNGLMGVMRAFDRNSDATKFRTAFSRRLKAIWLTIVLTIFSIIIIALFILQSELINQIINQFLLSKSLIKISSIASLIIILLLMVAIIYRYCPSLYTKVRFFNLGVFLATALILLISYTFIYLSTNIVHYDKVYGSLGTLFMFLVWVNLIALIILLGFEVNMTMLLKGNRTEELKEAIINNPKSEALKKAKRL